ncbi:hypothetical protein [Nocardia salmonicida]|uniref:nSTAND1 domain-containing NTPase n=1 Tax=Nocardia salmonicida TaxID=53431 RepID=UPI002E2B187A|nr:hypothetical protein [Nocardia salmonicida]
MIAIRAEYYGRIVEWPWHTHDAVEQVVMKPMTAHQLTEMIVAPARLAGIDVEQALVGELVREFGAGSMYYDSGSLPLIQLALHQAYATHHGTDLTLSNYFAARGMRSAIERIADIKFGHMATRNREVAQRVLPQCVAVNEMGLSRRVVARDHLCWADTPNDIIDGVIDSLIDTRLLTESAGTVMISHDAILTGWNTPQEWIHNDTHDLKNRQMLTDMTNVWISHDRSEDWLGSPGIASIFASAGKQTMRLLTDNELQFLHAHRKQSRSRWSPFRSRGRQ